MVSLVLLCSFVVSSVASASGEPTKLRLHDEDLSYSVNAYMDVLEDPTGQLLLSDILTTEVQEQFSPADGLSSFGFTESAYWVRVNLQNDSSHAEWEISLLNPLLNRLEFYTIGQADAAPLDLGRQYPTYAFTLPPGQAATMYFRTEISGSMILPFRLTEQSDAQDVVQMEFLLYGLYYGIAVAIMIYMFTMYRSVKKLEYMYYILYIFFFSASQVVWNGFPLTWITPDDYAHLFDNGFLFSSLYAVYDFFFLICLLFAYHALRRFLGVHSQLPVVSWIARIIFTLYPVAVVVSAVNYTAGIAQILSYLKAAGMIVILLLIFGCAYRGDKLAKKVSIAVLPHFLIAGPSLLLSFGLLSDNLITHFGMQIGSACEFLIMAVIFHDQVTDILRKREEAQVALMKTMMEWNASLEKAVEEKTESLKATAEELLEAEKSRSHMLQNISHDVRSPLNYVQGGIQTLMLGREGRGEQQEQLLEKVYQKVIDVNRFIDDFTTLSRLDITQGAVTRELVIFYEWMEDVLKEQAAYIEHAGHRYDIKITGNESEPDVLIDPHLMKRAITNLVTNACKYTPPNGMITLELSSLENDVQIMVGDTGRGIDPAQLPHIFRRYYNEGAGRGNGLGLAIAKEIVEWHGGDIRVESEPEQGSRFYLRLPIYKG